MVKVKLCRDYVPTQAGLFAAFLAAFLIETLRRLEEDSTATLLDVMVYQTQMMRNETLPPYFRVPFTPSRKIVAANVLCFASLALILVVAFISMLVKGWIREFDRGLAAIVKLRQRALVREYRYLGLERWKLLEIIHFLPVLIYCSLFPILLWTLALPPSDQSDLRCRDFRYFCTGCPLLHDNHGNCYIL